MLAKMNLLKSLFLVLFFNVSEFVPEVDNNVLLVNGQSNKVYGWQCNEEYQIYGISELHSNSEGSGGRKQILDLPIELSAV